MIAVFYHCLISARHRVIPEDYAMEMVMSQMTAMMVSGLMEAASEVNVYVNGSPSEAAVISAVCDPKAKVLCNGVEANSEIPTMAEVHKWAVAHPKSLVLYHHTKGVSTPHQADRWRERMERYMIWNWKDCVDLLLHQGFDAVGCHWLTPEANPGAIASPFFGGNFWWAKSDYIARLPALPTDTWENRYEAESWIGRGTPRPKIYDPSPGWPTL